MSRGSLGRILWLLPITTACALLLSVVVTIFCNSAVQAAANVIGRASVIDGDTIEIHGTRIRLFGVDAPEGKQLCNKDNKPWRCGQDAAWALANLIGSKTIHCEERDRDRFKRIVAVCHLGNAKGPDLSAWLVQQGWALAFRRYSRDYIKQEEDAKAAKRGIWASSFVPPWDERKKRKSK